MLVLYNEIMDKEKLTQNDIEIYIMNQANKFMLDNLKNKLNIHDSKLHRSYKNYSNTVSSTIPFWLKIELMKKHDTVDKKTALLLGFGEGLSIETVLRFRSER